VRVLVTGGAGFIGSHVVDRLVADGHAVDVVDNLSTGRRERVNAAARLFVCDLRSARLDGAFAAARPEAIVHLAAQAAVPRSVADPRFDASVTVLGTLAVLDAARRVAVRRVVYISTGGAVYGDTDVLPTPEDHPTRPASPYGVSKLAGERYLECWAGLTGTPTLTLRLAKARVRESPDAAEELLSGAAEELAHALEELRELARGIHPAVLTEHGLAPALETLVGRAPIPVAVDANLDGRLPPPVEAAAFYVVSEALANVTKYADASAVEVRVGRANGYAVVEVADDGVGGADPARGSGLRGLADRVEALQGKLEIESRPGEGTRVRAEIPVP